MRRTRAYYDGLKERDAEIAKLRIKLSELRQILLAMKKLSREGVEKSKP